MGQSGNSKSSIIKNNRNFYCSVDDFSLLNMIDIVIVEPKSSENVGAAIRAISNMGIGGRVFIAGSKDIITDSSKKLAKHAKKRLDEICFFSSFKEVLLNYSSREEVLVLAASARSGSNKRPHPYYCSEAVALALSKLKSNLIKKIVFVFGPESDGLSNDDVALCDWVVTIPASSEYRSLNLAQAILVFAYEAHKFVLSLNEKKIGDIKYAMIPLANKFIKLAEKVGFILPNDPFKMKARVESLITRLSITNDDLRLLHGLIDQINRTIINGKVTYKGRYKHAIEKGIKLL